MKEEGEQRSEMPEKAIASSFPVPGLQHKVLMTVCQPLGFTLPELATSLKFVTHKERDKFRRGGQNVQSSKKKAFFCELKSLFHSANKFARPQRKIINDGSEKFILFAMTKTQG